MLFSYVIFFSKKGKKKKRHRNISQNGPAGPFIFEYCFLNQKICSLHVVGSWTMQSFKPRQGIPDAQTSLNPKKPIS